MLVAPSAIDPQLAAPLWVCLGAVPGALLRYYLTRCLQRLGAAFPYGTFFINLTGSGGMGFFTALMGRSIAVADLRLLVAVGFLGAYTTFSTYVLDTSTMWQSGKRKRALFYGLGSAILGLVALAIGRWLGKNLP